MKGNAARLLLMLAAANCAAQETEDPVITAAKARVEYKLRDPGSAQYRDLRVITTRSDPIVCGEVNGKNAYGGYVGFVPFAVLGESAVLVSDSSASIRELELNLVQHMCTPKADGGS